MVGQVNFEKTRKDREISVNIKLNGHNSLQKKYLFCSRGNIVLFREIDRHIPIVTGGQLLKERNRSSQGANSLL